MSALRLFFTLILLFSFSLQAEAGRSAAAPKKKNQVVLRGALDLKGGKDTQWYLDRFRQVVDNPKKGCLTKEKTRKYLVQIHSEIPKDDLRGGDQKYQIAKTLQRLNQACGPKAEPADAAPAVVPASAGTTSASNVR
jgi:hypothetical protein